MKKNKWLYMHTIDNIPAHYIEGEQIVYAHSTYGQAGVRYLCESLAQIRKEEALSAKWRIKMNCPLSNLGYGYVRILRKPIVK